MGRLARAVKTMFQTRGSAPGKAVVVQTAAAGNAERTTEMYHPPGISSGPTAGDRVVEIPLSGGTRVIIASHNYRVEVDAAAGETKIYSTDTDGTQVKGLISLKTDGTIEINGGDKYLVLHSELDSILQGFVTAMNTALAAKVDGGGSPGTLSLDISAASTTTVKTGG
jgi:phage gp45-like